MARDVREAALALVELGEQRDDLCHLRARDGRVGAERAVGIAVHDAGLRHGGNRGVIPRVRRHVGISVGLGQVRAAALLRQQAEEDGRRLGAGDLAVRLHRAVRITDDVGEVVVVRVQAESILIGNLHLGLLRLGGMAGRVVLGKGSVDRVVGHHLFKRVRAHRADALAVHQHVLDVIAGIWRDGKGLAFALGHGDCALGVDRTVLASRCGDNANFIDLDLQQMRSVRRIGVPNTDTVICTEIEWRIGLFAIHNMILSKNNKDEKQSIDSSISTLMATEPNSADEASKLYNQLMEKENEILSTDKALWEKVFMASNKDNPMIEDGTNYGDFLLKTIEGAKDQFTDEEYKKLVAGAEQIKEIEGKLTILEQKYPECANAPSNGDSVPADSNGVISKGGGATSFPSFDGKDLDRKSTRLNSSHTDISRMPSSA